MRWCFTRTLRQTVEYSVDVLNFLVAFFFSSLLFRPKLGYNFPIFRAVVIFNRRFRIDKCGQLLSKKKEKGFFEEPLVGLWRGLPTYSRIVWTLKRHSLWRVILVKATATSSPQKSRRFQASGGMTQSYKFPFTLFRTVFQDPLKISKCTLHSEAL